MRLLLPALLSISLLMSCNNGEKAPDVSNIPVTLTTERFEKKLFDTTSGNLVSYLQRLNTGDGTFTQNYLVKILNVDPLWPTDTAAAYVNGFIHSYRPIYDSVEKVFSDFTQYEKEIKKGLQFVKYYFPAYKAPSKVITYIGPADGYGDVISEDGFLVGLQLHLGKDFSFYKNELVQQTYPEYMSRRFEPDYIAVNCLRNIVDDMYPEKQEDKTLIIQMIEKGKRLYLLKKFLPGTDDYKLIGYTKEQMKDSYNHEAVIWDLFVKNNYLQVTDKNILKNFIEEGPKTQELGEGAPGNVGSFAGWQIVKKYMEKKPATTLPQLMTTDPELIFQEAKYKP